MTEERYLFMNAVLAGTISVTIVQAAAPPSPGGDAPAPAPRRAATVRIHPPA